ncbi:MAG: response regulator [Syntrophales bacterium]
MPKHKIMIVEDEGIVAADIQTSIEKMGYAVCAMASSGMEAIQKADSTRPDLILMDIVLKGSMDGIEAATWIKELYKIPVVYLTAFGDDSILQRAKVAEPYAYITKPFNQRELQIAIEISIYKKQAEDRIRKMEFWLATVLKSIGDAVIASDKDRRITFMNAVAEKLTGWNHEDALGKNLTEVLNIKDRDLLDLEKHLVEKVITEGLIINLIEDRLLIAKDGSELPISDSAAPIKNDNNESPGSVIVFRDITEHKELQENLRTHQVELEMQNAELLRKQEELNIARARYFDLYDLAPVGYCTVNEKGLIIEANLTLSTLLKLPRGALVNEPFSKLILSEDYDIYYLNHKQLMATGEPQACELRIVKKDGSAFWGHLMMTTTQDADGALVCRVVLSDISELKQTNELFSLFMRYSPVYTYIKEVTPTQSLVLQASDNFAAMIGLPGTEMIGKTMTELFPPEFAAKVTAEDWAVVSGREVLRLEEELNGRIFDTIKFPIVRGDKTLLAGYTVDISERKRAEEDRIVMENHLFQAQKMDAIGILAGGIAHDFNNILAAIIGYTEMAMDESQKEIRQRYLQETLNGSERARNLIRQILTFSRQDSHEKKPLDIKLLLTEAVKFLRASIPATIEIRQILTDDSCNIMADPTQIHQIIINLCTNATYAMKQTGGELTLEASAIELSKAEIPHNPDLKPGHYVKLTVSDTGYGIDPVNIQRIFDPFFTTKPKDEGTGLGLSVVYGIVKSHGGVITVYSEPGKGTNFHVYLPMIIHKEVANTNVPGRTIAGGTERILFVDDEPSLVDIGTNMLSSLGYKVTGVTSSMEALNLFRAEPTHFDLVITDMTLPKMTGIELSREVMRIRPDIPIILCSGIRESDTEAQVKSLGIKAYCTKPLTKRDLSRVIRETMDGHENPLL